VFSSFRIACHFLARVVFSASFQMCRPDFGSRRSQPIHGYTGLSKRRLWIFPYHLPGAQQEHRHHLRAGQLGGHAYVVEGENQLKSIGKAEDRGPIEELDRRRLQRQCLTTPRSARALSAHAHTRLHDYGLGAPPCGKQLIDARGVDLVADLNQLPLQRHALWVRGKLRAADPEGICDERWFRRGHSEGLPTRRGALSILDVMF
jgi:hypothetical protein